MHVARRKLLRGIGLGAGATFLSPLVSRLVSEAYGQAQNRLNLIVFTDGNGWGHQGMSRTGETLNTTVRSMDDWDLPEALAPLAPYKNRITIARPLFNPHDQNLHGNGWATLSVVNGDGHNPGGISLDRLVALSTGMMDPFPSIALAVALRKDRPPICNSSDGPRKPFPAIGHPLVAFTQMFGAPGSNLAAVRAALQQEKSLLDGMAGDVDLARRALAGPERLKFDQLMESYRALERQMIERDAIFSKRPPPPAPAGGAALDKLGLAPEVINAHADILANALSYGLTHVAHLSVLGNDAHNAGWGALGFPGDAHEDLSHISGGYDKPRATMAVMTITQFKAGVLARIAATLEKIPTGNGNLLDRTIMVWVNSGGGKHHDGYNTHPIVIIGGGGKLKTNRYLEIPQMTRCISDAFLAVAQAMDVKVSVFGDPKHNKGPLPGLV